MINLSSFKSIVAVLPTSFASVRVALRTMGAAAVALVFFSTGSFAKDAASVDEGELRQSLNGAWDFTIDPTAVTSAEGAWDMLTVPENWDTTPAYSKHRGKGWYRRTFTIPADWRGKQVRLCFDAVYHKAEVSLNGKSLGSHIGGYTPFEFDVTAHLDWNGVNTVVVMADNSYARGAWWPWGGISRDVTLRANNDARIVWQHIRSEPDLKTGASRIFVRYKIANTSDKQISAQLTSVIRPVNRVLRQSVTLPPGVGTIVELETDMPAKEVRLWHFDRPELYTLETRLVAGSGILHGRKDRFGIRKVEFTSDGLYLNGEKIRVAGFNRVSDSNQFGNTEPDELVRRDVDLMKEAGAVFSRLMHTPQAPNLLDYLDEKGMMIFAEIPVWGEGDPQVKTDNPRTKQWLREMIERDYNHPCIIGWSPGNEVTKHYAYVASMTDYIRKELDPHRQVAYASFTAYRDNYSRENDPVTVSDVALINTYALGGKGEAFAARVEKMRERWPDKAVFFSEFGSRQIGGSPKSHIPHLQSVWENITRDPAVIGGALWTFNDYRSSMGGTPASGNREWGAVTVDRRPKEAYWQIRKLFSPVNSIAVADGVVTIKPRTPAEVPSYTLRGYTIEWTLTDAAGAVTSRGSLPLPELAPGSPVWTGEIPGAGNGANATACLVTPTGYRVDDTLTRPAQ